MAQSTVYFATNRPPDGPADEVASYTTGIQPPSDSSGMIYGTAFVGGIDVAGNVQGTVGAITDISVGRFSPDAAGDLADAGRNLLVFIHGFDNSFSDALTRAAFNREWLSASKAEAADMSVVAFSWPSLGEVLDGPVLPDAYKRDQTMARLSGQHLMTFFANLEPILTAARAQGRKTYLLAHSMAILRCRARWKTGSCMATARPTCSTWRSWPPAIAAPTRSTSRSRRASAGCPGCRERS